MHGACVKDTGVPCDRAGLRRLLQEMVKTSSRRGGFRTWEYYFSFGGGAPPWISGMAQATGIQAFARASQLLGDPSYLTYARDAFGAFQRRPPPAPPRPARFGGPHYLQYSFAPRLFIFNAFMQSVIGLYDYATITGDQSARALFARAEPEARLEVPASDTGDWSRYSFRGRESTREYHELLREFMAGLCNRVKAAEYCSAARRYRGYMTDPAELVFTGPPDGGEGRGDRRSPSPSPSSRPWRSRSPRRARRRSTRWPRSAAATAPSPGGLAPPAPTRSSSRRRSCARGRGCARGRAADRVGAVAGGLGPRASGLGLRSARGSADDPVHRQGRRRQDHRRRRHRAALRRCGASHGGALHRSGPHAVGLPRSAELGNAPTEVGPGLWGQEVQAQEEMERNWEAVSGWLGDLLADRGVDRISAEELTVPPGMDELFSLLQIKHHHESGEFDAIIVDCAPTGETLRLLSFPDVCTWWLEKVFPFRGPMVAAARPFAGMLDMPLPSEAVFDDIERLVRNLVAMNGILRDRSATSIRLVMTPDRMVVKEAMRTFTYLNLYGYLTDAVVVNRVFPEEAADRLLRRLARAPAGASRAGALGLRPDPDPHRPVLLGRGDRARDARQAGRRAVRR